MLMDSFFININQNNIKKITSKSKYLYFLLLMKSTIGGKQYDANK